MACTEKVRRLDWKVWMERGGGMRKRMDEHVCQCSPWIPFPTSTFTLSVRKAKEFDLEDWGKFGDLYGDVHPSLALIPKPDFSEAWSMHFPNKQWSQVWYRYYTNTSVMEGAGLMLHCHTQSTFSSVYFILPTMHEVHIGLMTLRFARKLFIDVIIRKYCPFTISLTKARGNFFF